MAVARADVHTLVRLWNTGEWVAGIVADICAQHTNPNHETITALFHPGRTFSSLDEDEQEVIKAGLQLFLERRASRKRYDQYWADRA